MSRSEPTVDLGYPTPARGRIPAFKSLEEEAAFWDTHDIIDFLNESSPVQATVGNDLPERLTLRLARADRERLAALSREKEIGPSTLACMWLKERLSSELEVQTRSR
jgi:hypothetical protein